MRRDVHDVVVGVLGDVAERVVAPVALVDGRGGLVDLDRVDALAAVRLSAAWKPPTPAKRSTNLNETCRRHDTRSLGAAVAEVCIDTACCSNKSSTACGDRPRPFQRVPLAPSVGPRAGPPSVATVFDKAAEGPIDQRRKLD